ncbi:hypothetical protein [Roseateles sp. BYS87W]|uniref:Uncharacterized protein n=1 Tax=Pelomonas baiyunensis TaxID=3299026 RepID=A0ABW7GW13_9BURK
MTGARRLMAALLALCASAGRADDGAASAPAAAAASSAGQRVTTKIVRSVDGRRDWEGSYAIASATRKLNLFCLKSDTGRCGFRVIDARKSGAAPSGSWDLEVEWIGLPVGAHAERVLKGEAYAVCVRPDVGRDDACEPSTALTAF